MAEEDKKQTILLTQPGIQAWGLGLPPGPSIQSFFSGETVVQVACGKDHSAVVCESGKVFTFGKNQDNGWMDVGTNMITPPRLVATLAPIRVTQAACGVQHTVFLTDKGELYSCGDNTYGQLGLGHTGKTPSPILVTGLPPIKKVAAGFGHTVALADSGEVWVTGCNHRGQLGLGHENNQTSFTCVLYLPESVIDISCGWYHTALLSTSQVLLMSGSNFYGKLGLGAIGSVSTFKTVLVPSSAVAAVSCSDQHSVVLGADGTVWSFGHNDCGQLGTMDIIASSTPTQITGLENYTITEVIAEYHHTALLTENGDVLVCGREQDGELGQGKEVLCVPTLIPKSPGLVVKQVAFAETYSLILVGPKSIIIPTLELECGATLQANQARGCVTDLEWSIMRSLECPVCFKMMHPPIHQCSNGHSLCDTCRSHTNITVCPLCQEVFTKGRNVSLEKIIEDIQLPCIECLQRMPTGELENHSKVCPKRKYRCPVQRLCPWSGRSETVLAHTSSAHPDHTWQDLPHLFLHSMSDELVHTDVLSAHNQVFTLHRKYNKTSGEFKATVMFIGPPKEKDKFEFEFKFLIKRCKRTFLVNICTDIESVDEAFQSPNCVVMKKKSVDKFLHRGCLVCRVAIIVKVKSAALAAKVDSLFTE